MRKPVGIPWSKQRILVQPGNWWKEKLSLIGGDAIFWGLILVPPCSGEKIPVGQIWRRYRSWKLWGEGVFSWTSPEWSKSTWVSLTKSTWGARTAEKSSPRVPPDQGSRMFQSTAVEKGQVVSERSVSWFGQDFSSFRTESPMSLEAPQPWENQDSWSLVTVVQWLPAGITWWALKNTDAWASLWR